MSIQLDFSGELVVVTGGATGLGFATARAFGLCGATIALNDLTEDRVEAACERLRQESIACRGYMADVRDAEAVSALVTTFEEELGAPSVVVANAGLYPNTPFLEMSEAEWDRVIDTNLKGVFLICQAAARSMVWAGKAGRIIVISSTAATRHLGLVTLLHIQGSHGYADARDGAGVGKARHPRQCRTSGVHRRRGWR